VDDLEIMWNEVVMALFNASVSQYVPGETDKDHEIFVTGYRTSGLGFKPGTSGICNRRVRHSAAVYLYNRHLQHSGTILKLHNIYSHCSQQVCVAYTVQQ
jgi:hypothetical protein